MDFRVSCWNQIYNLGVDFLVYGGSGVRGAAFESFPFLNFFIFGPSQMLTIGNGVFVITELLSAAIVGLSVYTISLARYPVKSERAGGIKLTGQLLALFWTRKALRTFQDNPLSHRQRRTYKLYAEVAKNIVSSFLVIIAATAIAYFAFSYLDAKVSGLDIFFLAITVVITFFQVRVYDMEKRIYYGKLPASYYVLTPEEAQAPSGDTQTSSGLHEKKSDVSSKPIIDRFNHDDFLSDLKASRGQIGEIIEKDKQNVERRLKQSKLGEQLELSGARAKKTD